MPSPLQSDKDHNMQPRQLIMIKTSRLTVLQKKPDDKNLEDSHTAN